MKVMITGAGGQLARELWMTRVKGWEVFMFERSQLDISQPREVFSVFDEYKPDIVINTAAFTSVDAAEQQPDKATAVNSEGAFYMARAALQHRTHLIHISTDYVFNGCQPWPYLPDDPCYPVNAYGRSKWDGECLIRQCMTSHLIVRSSWLYAANGKNFVTKMLQILRDNKHASVVFDEIGSPTWARGLAETLWIAARQRLTGTYHWSDAGVASRYDFACAINELGQGMNLLPQEDISIVPVRSSEHRNTVRRPPFSVLDTTRTWNALNLTPVHWAVQLRRMMSEMQVSDAQN